MHHNMNNMSFSFAAMGIFVGMNSWNSFILPVLLLSRDNRTLPVFLETLLSPYKNNYDLLIVGAYGGFSGDMI